jgi:DNA-binding MarR family transcriptional regulator
MITRRTTAADRRVRTLHLTNRGRTMVRTLVNVEAAHEQALSVGLDEREQLVGLLRKAAACLGLGTVHSGIDAPDW